MTAGKFYFDATLANLFICGTSNQPIFLEIVASTGEIVRSKKFVTANTLSTYVHANTVMLGSANNVHFTLTS